jgi:tRNA pseudouridine55 synthase
MTKPRKPATHHGYIVIDKPGGWTSHDVVARVRRIVGERRVGHAGTLDPAATGVLPVAVGLATRTIEYLANADKGYLADFTFGITTDSADGDGVVQDRRDPSHLDRTAVESAIREFVGPLQQVPPMHSAIKIDGTPLYDLARKGQTVELPARAIAIHAINVVHWHPPTVRVHVRCSKGTYVRSLARDIGDRMGTGAYLSRLVRTSVGRFGLDVAMTLDELALAMERDEWRQVRVEPDVAMLDYDAVVIAGNQIVDWACGRPVPADGAEGVVRVYDADGKWRGVGNVEPDTALVKPVKVIHPGQAES